MVSLHLYWVNNSTLLKPLKKWTFLYSELPMYVPRTWFQESYHICCCIPGIFYFMLESNVSTEPADMLLLMVVVRTSENLPAIWLYEPLSINYTLTCLQQSLLGFSVWIFSHLRLDLSHSILGYVLNWENSQLKRQKWCYWSWKVVGYWQKLPSTVLF